MAQAYKKADSGFYQPDLCKNFEHCGFLYKPSQRVTVNEEILEAMIADEAVCSDGGKLKISPVG